MLDPIWIKAIEAYEMVARQNDRRVAVEAGNKKAEVFYDHNFGHIVMLISEVAAPPMVMNVAENGGD